MTPVCTLQLVHVCSLTGTHRCPCSREAVHVSQCVSYCPLPQHMWVPPPTCRGRHHEPRPLLTAGSGDWSWHSSSSLCHCLPHSFACLQFFSFHSITAWHAMETHQLSYHCSRQPMTLVGCGRHGCSPRAWHTSPPAHAPTGEWDRLLPCSACVCVRCNSLQLSGLLAPPPTSAAVFSLLPHPRWVGQPSSHHPGRVLSPPHSPLCL